MAKRSRRSNKSTARRISTPVKPVSAAPSKKVQAEINFAEEYFYVYDDMRVMVILTVLMMLVMFGLSFVF